MRWPWQPKPLPAIIYMTPLNSWGYPCDHCWRDPHTKNCPVRRVQENRP